jgi:glycosyltransferase involved in cell wall biosynthesis
MTKKLSVVLSFFNEYEVLDELITRLKKVIGDQLGYEYELIFVNDRSTDRSVELLLDAREKDPNIKIVTMSRNFGVSECVLAGMELATGDAIVIMDTDLQDPPEVIPDLVKEWNKGADVVYTVRTSRDGESRIKMWITQLGYRLIRSISSIDLPMQSGDFKLMSRRVVKHVIAMKEHEPYLRGLVRFVGFNQVPVYYDRDARLAGETHFRIYGPKTIKNYISGVTSFSDVPLYLIFALGITVCMGAFSYLLIIVAMRLMGWNLPGWSAIMATVLFLGATQSLAIGILGLYVAKIHIEVKRRPNFIIDKVEGVDMPPSIGTH